MKIFVITMLTALVASIVIEGCIVESSAAAQIRVVGRVAKFISKFGKNKSVIATKYKEIVGLVERTPREFGYLDDLDGLARQKVPKLITDGNGGGDMYLEHLSYRAEKDLKNSLEYINRRKLEMKAERAEIREEIVGDTTLTQQWKRAFALDGVSMLDSRSKLNEGLIELTGADDELLFAINSHDTAARLAATIEKRRAEITRHLNKIIDLLREDDRAYLQVNIDDWMVASSKSLSISHSTTADELREIVRLYEAYIK